MSDVLTGPIDAVRRRAVALRERAATEPLPALRAETIETLDLALAALQEAEQQLETRRQPDEALRRSEARLRQVLESDLIGVVHAYADGRVSYANDHLLRMLGLTREDLQPGKLDWRDLTPPEYAKADTQAIKQAYSGRVGGLYEKEFFHRDGSRVSVLVGFGALDRIQDEGVVFVLDITARKRAEQGLLAARAELETRVAERTAALAHANEELQRELSERLQAEAAQRESEERFAKAFQHAPVGMALADGHGRLFQVNDALCELFGYSPQEFLQKTGPDLLHPEDLPAWLADQRRLATGESSTYHAERRYIHKSGRAIFGQTSVSALRGPDGRIAEYVIQWRDVTAQREATEALRRSEERFALAMAGAKDGLWDWDLEAGRGYISPRWKAILGFEDHEIQPLFVEWVGRIHPEDAERVQAAVQAHLKGLTAHFECEYRIRHKDGSYRWVISRALAVRDAGGKACRMAGSMTDITERKRVEESLQKSELRLQSILDNSSTVVFLKDLEGRYITVNRRYEELFHVTRQTIAGKSDHDIFPRENADRFRQHDQLALEKRAPCEAEEIVPQDDGPHVYISVKFPLFGADGKPYAVCGIATDITARKQAEVALRESEGRLQLLSRRLLELQETERRTLACELHDEIGQTLTAVKFMLDNLMRLPRAAAEQRLEETKQLIDDLLQRVRDLSLALRPAMLDDLGVLPALMWLFDRYTAQTGITVAFEHRGLQRRFTRDRETATYRIVQEALTNVARHAGVADVTVGVWLEDGVLRVRIADEGVGFDADAALAAGTSGGLPGMRERAMLLGGSLAVHSAPGRGTTVSALFPSMEPSPD